MTLLQIITNTPTHRCQWWSSQFIVFQYRSDASLSWGEPEWAAHCWLHIVSWHTYYITIHVVTIYCTVQWVYIDSAHQRYAGDHTMCTWSIVEVAYKNQKQVSMCASTWAIMAPSLTNTALSLDHRPFWLEGLWFRWCCTQHSHHSHSWLGWFGSVHGHSTVVKCWNMLIWNKNRHT